MNFSQELAECVGLWLAEGGTKTSSEITFTNNCPPLITFFSKTIQKKFCKKKFNSRIYIYSPSKTKKKFLFSSEHAIKHYIDKRARKPYFIFRLASKEISKEWKDVVRRTKKNSDNNPHVLRGFFAGEGNIKKGSHSNRAIRIAQKEPNKYVEKVLNYTDITFRFSSKERAYVITGIWNWKKLSELKIADLHPIKKKNFTKLFESFIEEHYPNDTIKKKIPEILKNPKTSLELARKFKRSQARIQDILIPMGKAGKIKKFKVGSTYYWLNSDRNAIVISRVKRKYILSLNDTKNKTTADLAKEMKVCWKSAHRRLMELQNLNLVKKNSNGLWKKVNTEQEVITI